MMVIIQNMYCRLTTVSFYLKNIIIVIIIIIIIIMIITAALKLTESFLIAVY